MKATYIAKSASSFTGSSVSLEKCIALGAVVLGLLGLSPMPQTSITLPQASSYPDAVNESGVLFSPYSVSNLYA